MTDDYSDDWMTTYTGKKFYPTNPRVEDVDIEDIAHALSLMCRFGGHCKHFYSVAQHSYEAAKFATKIDPEIVLEVLMHDAAEAYVGDMIRPLKRCMPLFKEMEEKVHSAIVKKFGLRSYPRIVKAIDDTLLKNEHRCVINDGHDWLVDLLDCQVLEIVPVGPIEAETEFLRMFNAWKR